LGLDVEALVERREDIRRRRILTSAVEHSGVGTLQPIRQVVALASAHGIPVHTDAVQAVGQVPVDFAASW